MKAKDLLSGEHYLALIAGLKTYGVKVKEIDGLDINKATDEIIDLFAKATGKKIDSIADVVKNDYEELLRYLVYMARNYSEGKFVSFQVPLNIVQFAIMKHFPDKLVAYITIFSEDDLEDNLAFAREGYENAAASELIMPKKVELPKLSEKDELLLREAEVTAAMPMPDYSGMSQKEIMDDFHSMSNHALVPLLTEGLIEGLNFYKAANTQDTNVSVELDTNNGVMSLYWGEDYSDDDQPFFRHNIGVTLKTCAAMLRATDASFRHALSNWFEDAVPNIPQDVLQGMEITLWVPELGGAPYLELFE